MSAHEVNMQTRAGMKAAPTRKLFKANIFNT